MFIKKYCLIWNFAIILTLLNLFSIGTQVFAEQEKPAQQADLFDMSLEELMDIEVTTASKKPESLYEASGIVSVMTKEEIRMFGAKNLWDLLNRMPGVYGASNFLFPLNVMTIRGDDTASLNHHTLILINGRPFRESLAGGVNSPIFAGYPIEMIERIELVRGPGSVLYGTNAYTGVINIITKTADSDSLSIIGEGGSYGYGKTGLSAGKVFSDKFKLFTAGDWTQTDGWRFSATDELGVKNSDSANFQSGSVAALAEYGDFTFNVFYTRQDTFNVGRAMMWALSGAEIDQHRLFFDIGHNLRFNDQWRLQTNLTYNDRDFTFENERNWRTSRDILGETTLFGEIGEKTSVLGGYLIEHQGSRDSSSSSVPNYSKVPQSAYAQADHKLFDWLKLFGGVQWNKPQDSDSDLISRGGTIITINKNWGLKLLRGEAFRAPWQCEMASDNPVFVGNPDLTPEKVVTYDAQLFYHSRKTTLAVTYFKSTMKSLVTQVASGGVINHENRGELDFWGLELEGKHYFCDNLYILGSLTHQDSHEDSGLNRVLIPNTMGKAGLGYQNKKMSAGIFYTYFSTPPAIEGLSDVNPDAESVHMVNINFNFDVTNLMNMQNGGKATLTFRIENLFDQSVHQPSFYRRRVNSVPTDPGIMLYGGLRIDF